MQRLLTLLASYRQPVPLATAVSQWKVRGVLPRPWAAPILYVLLRDGVDLSPIFDGVPATRSLHQ